MPITCIAIDDEPPALLLLSQYIAQFNQLQLVHTFSDAISGSEYLRNNPVDLLFIDINMPDITGLDLVKSLEKKPMIVFTTAYKKFALEGFELDAIDYLLKPVSPERFAKAVNKAVEYHQFKNQTARLSYENLFVYSEYKMVKITAADIVYIESLEDYIRIHLKNDTRIMTLMTMKKVLDSLPPDKFSRIHRSYIVANEAVKTIHNRKATLSNEKELPISESYLDFIDNWRRQTQR
ncbi:LytR/AlgR family response regulator transcription factor [Terrimonas rubra]|uniref:LytR/AlgR family response regulator transcription factor n=1 Tax=Terrimonas rubra TaxID=1035890 RepID=A0ABW6A1P7_9BACT